jgi:hypothetical protein
VFRVLLNFKRVLEQNSLLWKMIIYSVIMLVTGYLGEVVAQKALLCWVTRAAYFYYYEIWFGKIAAAAEVQKTAKFMLVRTCRMGNLSIGIHDGNWDGLQLGIIQQVTI